MSKDWTGNSKTTFVQLGASNHSLKDREVNDFYATDPNSLEIFLKALERDNIKLHHNIWECACGQGHLSNVLINNNYEVYSSDLINRGYGETKDFLKCNNLFPGDILTNPPYKNAKDFVKHSLDLLEEGNYYIMFLKIQFLEGKDRRKLFDKFPPKYVYVNSARQLCAMNGEFEKYNATALCYCWFIWEKGFKGEPIIRWI